MARHRCFVWTVLLVAAGSALVGCTSSANDSKPIDSTPIDSASSPTVTTPVTDAATVEHGVVAVGYDDNANVISFYAADGTTLGSIDVPEMLTLQRQILPSRFVYGRSIDGPLTVVDASTMTLASYDLDPQFTTFTEVNSQVVAASAVGGSADSDVLLIDLTTGSMTSLRDLIGRPGATWRRSDSVGETVVVFTDTNTLQSTVIPRNDPVSAWEADSVIADVDGDTSVGRQLGDRTGDEVVRVYRGSDHASIAGAWDSIDPAKVVGVYLLSDSQVVIAMSSGDFTSIDLDTGVTTTRGSLGAPFEGLREIADNIAVAVAGDVAALLDDSSIKPIEVNNDGTYFLYGSGEKCALIERYHSSDSDQETTSFVLDLGTNAILAELGSDPTPLSVDGCSAVDALQTTAVVGGNVFELDHGRLFDLDESQTRVLLRTSDGITHIMQVGDRSGVDLPSGRDFRFVELDATAAAPPSL